jgi:hypothetical protein
MPTRAWNEADPANADNASLGAQEIRELKVDVKERMLLEHLFPLLIGSTEAGMHAWDYKTKTISYQLAVTDHFIFATQGTTQTLPAIAAANKGKAFAIKVNGTGTVTIARTGADTIDGATTLALTGTALGGEVAYLISDGVSDWKRYITYKPDESAGIALSGYKNLVIKSVADHVSVDIDADEVLMVNSSGQMKRATSVNLTVDLDVSAAINGRDSGSVAANQGWFLYVISNGTTTAGLASESATAPTLPSGYTYKCLVGWCTTDATATPFNVEEFTQIDEEYIWTTPQKVKNDLTGVTTTQTADLSTGGVLGYATVPPNLTRVVKGRIHITGGVNWFCNPLTFADGLTMGGDVAYIEQWDQSGGVAGGFPYQIPIITSQTFYHQLGAGGTLDLWVSGFTLKR